MKCDHFSGNPAPPETSPVTACGTERTTSENNSMKMIFTIILLCVIGTTAYCQDAPGTFIAKPPQPWISDGIIYQVFLRSFTSEGTLKAATRRLDDIAELGATIIYLSPVMLADTSTNREFWSPRQKTAPGNNPRNPYRIMDYYQIDPEYGTGDDLKEFIATAHRLGLRVLLDIVFSRTGPSYSSLTQNPENYLLDSHGKYLPDAYNFLRLNVASKGLREYLIKNLEYWIKEYDVDGFRCDSAGDTPVDFWDEARARVEKMRPDAAMLAEGNVPDQMLRAFDVSYGVHVWNYALRDVFVDGKPASFLRETWEKQNKRFPAGALLLRYSDNHDLRRTDMLFGEKGGKAVNVCNYMLDGVPFIYNGQEIGDGAPIGIWAHYPILWEAGGLPEKSTERNWYKQLITLRKSAKVLRSGKTIWLETDKPDAVAAFVRRDGDEEILTVVNVSNRLINDAVVALPEVKDGKYDVIFTNGKSKEVTMTKGKIHVPLESFGYLVCKPGKGAGTDK